MKHTVVSVFVLLAILAILANLGSAIPKTQIDYPPPVPQPPQPQVPQPGTWCLDEVARIWVNDGQPKPSNHELQCQNGQWRPFSNGTSADIPPGLNH